MDSILSNSLERLVSQNMPDLTPERSANYLSYLLRILSSRFPISSDISESNIKTILIQKLTIIFSDPRSDKSNLNSNVLRLQTLFESFMRKKVLTQKIGVLSLLAKISNYTKKARTEYLPIDSLFKTKKDEKESEMEIEHTPYKPSSSLPPPTSLPHPSSLPPPTYLPTPSSSFPPPSSSLPPLLQALTSKGCPSINLTESDLIRDILFTLQAVDGYSITYAKAEERFQVRSSLPLAAPIRRLVENVCEVGYMFKRITEKIGDNGKVQNNTSSNPDIKPNSPNFQINGMMREALSSAIRDELSDYFRFLAVLDSLRQTSSDLTMRKLRLWTIEPLERLTWLNLVWDVCWGLEGGQILSAIEGLRRQAPKAYDVRGGESPLGGGEEEEVVVGVGRGGWRTGGGVGREEGGRGGGRGRGGVGREGGGEGKSSSSYQIGRMLGRVGEKVGKVMGRFLKEWIERGELKDKFGEFFVEEGEEERGAREEGGGWRGKFRINFEKAPNFLDSKTIEKIFLTGKTVNFLRESCGVAIGGGREEGGRGKMEERGGKEEEEGRWRREGGGGRMEEGGWKKEGGGWDRRREEGEGRGGRREDEGRMEESGRKEDVDLWRISRSIDYSYELVNKRLRNMLFEKYDLEKHFIYLKKYLLCGQGDFIQTLMDLVHSELSKPAGQVFKHNLVNYMETAMRITNAQFQNQEFLGRVDVKLLEISPGDLGWDIFTLSYRIDPPLTAILPPSTIFSYLKIFNFLWRLKRIESSLSNLFLSHMKSDYMRILRKGLGNRKNTSEFHRCHLLRSEILYFIKSFLNYVMVEIIETSFRIFLDKVRQAKDIDQIIAVHDKFMQKVLEKTLLQPKTKNLYGQLVKILELAQKFRISQEILLGRAQEEAGRIREEVKRKDMMDILDEEGGVNEGRRVGGGKRGGGGRGGGRGGGWEEEGGLGGGMEEGGWEGCWSILRNIEKEFRDAVFLFQDLVRKEDSIDNLKFLSFRLDFNEFYSSNQDNKFQELSFQTKFPDLDPASKSPFINQNRGISPILGRVDRREGEEERTRAAEKKMKEEEERRRSEKERRKEEEGRRDDLLRKEEKKEGDKKKPAFEFDKSKPSFLMEKTKPKFEMDKPTAFDAEKNKQLAYKPALDFESSKIEKIKPFFEMEGHKQFQMEKNKSTFEIDSKKSFSEIEKSKPLFEIERFKPNFELERGKLYSDIERKSKPNYEIDKTKAIFEIENPLLYNFQKQKEIGNDNEGRKEEKSLDFEEFGKGVEIKGGFEGIFQHDMEEEEEEFLSDNHDSDTE